MEILIVAGDPSGDLHASHLIRALKRRAGRSLRVAAVGGPLMKAEADEFLEDLASRGVTGFWEPLVKLPFMARLALRLKRFMKERDADALICVDYYGFNRRVLGLAKKLGVPAFYYISPQVWASRPGRIQTLKKLVRRMLVIFPFEEELYATAGVPCSFVGHPLLDLVPAPEIEKLPGKPLRIGLLPGSRRSEIERHLPTLLDACGKLRAVYPDLVVEVFAPPSAPDSAYGAARAAGAEVVREKGYDHRRRLDLALCSSGTATLENALLGVPMVVLYKMSYVTYRIAKALIRVRHIAMANILAGETVVPELIQRDATAERLAEEALALLEDKARYADVRRKLLAVRASLGRPGAAERAADAILTEAGA